MFDSDTQCEYDEVIQVITPSVIKKKTSAIKPNCGNHARKSGNAGINAGDSDLKIAPVWVTNQGHTFEVVQELSFETACLENQVLGKLVFP